MLNIAEPAEKLQMLNMKMIFIVDHEWAINVIKFYLIWIVTQYFYICARIQPDRRNVQTYINY